MKLTDLNPKWVGHGGDGTVNPDGSEPPRRERVAISFDCPCGKCGRVAIMFSNPIDGLGPLQDHAWHREGDSFENLTLSPSILRHPCGWHGFIEQGKVRAV